MSIILDHVTKRYEKTTVVNDVSLEIETGELFVLLGSSGSGKSTLLRIIAGLTAADGGRICLNGRDVTHMPPRKRGSGFVFQNYSLFQHMNVAQNISFGLEIQKTTRREREQRIDELLTLIGLEGLGDRMPSQLSGGQQQRVALARALAPRPDLLLLDEPFGALDVKIRGQLRQNLREIQQRLGVTAILVTHDQDEAFELADRIGIIEGGRILEVGAPSELYRQPRHPFTATFLGSANLLRAQRNGTLVHMGDIELPAPPDTEHLSGQDVDILLRPESVALSQSSEKLDGHMLGRGIVESFVFAGSMERVTLRLQPTGETVQAVINPDEAIRLGLSEGRELWIGLKSFHLLPVRM